MLLFSLQSLLPYKEPEKNMAIRYGPPVLPKESAEVSVVVCHVNSPGDFYLQLVEDLDFLLFLKIINDAYKNEYEGENLEILCPVKGQACVARFEDGVLYRAEVLGFPGHREVEVKNVDVGSTTRIALQDICKVKDELLSFPRKAINCRLAHIEPSIRTGPWSTEAKEKFEEMISGRFLICSVDRIMEDDVLLVELFLSPHVPGMMANSVNSELVKRGLACYDPGCTPKENPTKHDEIWDPSLEEILLYEAKITGSAVKKPGMDQDGSELLDIQGLPVQFCHVVSPEKIYFHWFETESLLASLQEEMAAVYEGSNLEPLPWTSGMHCAVLMPQLKQWRRGQITRIISETLVEVFQFDYGVEMEVNVACLRKLKENLMEMGKFAVECCLVDIRPTGGSDRWTATTCDYLSFCLTGAVAKIIIQVCIQSKNPMPVKILCQDKTGRSFDFSAVLVEKGLALRVKRFPKADKSDLVSEASLAIPLMPVPKNPAVATCLKIFSKSEKEVTGDKASKPAFKPKTVETYKPPVIPSAKFFEAIISWVADDGTVYVIPKSSGKNFKMQGIFTSLDLLVPHSWKKEEACVIRGSDSQWYRGVILEIIDSCVKVQYLDLGYVEEIPPCHLYPVECSTELPQFCIPCQLYNTLPVGNFWSPDAVELLRELLLPKREVKIHNMASPEHPAGMLSVHLYFAGMSLSYFMAHHEHCTLEGSEDGLTSVKNRSENSVEEYWKISFEELHRPETKIRVLPPYSLLSLPLPGELFFVQVRHLVVPNERKAAWPRGKSPMLGVMKPWLYFWFHYLPIWAKQHYNLTFRLQPPFVADMPCLAQYSDGLWYRGKIISANGFDPLTVLVQFVDYGTWEKLPAGRLRQIPDSLMQYPAQAAKVTLTGFKPPKSDLEKVRIPYCPSWSMEAVWSMVDLLQGKRLQALTLTQTPEPMVLLFDDEQNPVYRPLVDMGLADLDE
uniref:Tudor domain-containing protein n=1 Tax=Ornithorhynchus anatinus TaxID=9258 RepID=A0A6I8P503_ORNAN